MTRKTTRERILEAALAEFDERGYEATTVAALCHRAGVSNGSFFHAFPSKEAVAAALFLAALAIYHEALIAAVPSETPAVKGVAALVTAHVRWVTRNRPTARFMFLHGQSADASVHRAEQAAANVRFRQGLAAWYEPNIQCGALLAASPELLVSQIIGPAQMFCRAWLSGRSSERPDRHLPTLIACAVRSVVLSSAEPSSKPVRQRRDRVLSPAK
ncbi:MAG: TetR/AcrR family transcriptional regulator [Alphaproteobacteria bacterium]|nr:TetR/AcrR family transcriptional regulator [Alphaproteobacteria bacterium]